MTKMTGLILISTGFLLFQFSCVSSSLRFPSSTEEIYKHSDLKQNLLLAAQNNILFHIPQDTLFESEKTVVDSKCQVTQKPFWSEKLSVYLSAMRSQPQFFTKFHILEIKKGDAAKVALEKDLDGALILSIQYGKSESRGQVTMKTHLPCESQKIVEFLGQEIIKTQYDFPTIDQLKLVLNQAVEKKSVKRFEFSNDFISYLAERGFILKFNHELSFEKNTKNQFVMIEVLNKLSRELKLKKDNKHVQLWMKILNDANKADDIVQMFSIENQSDQKAGLKTGIKFIFDQKNISENQFLNQLYITYTDNQGETLSSNLSDLNICLSEISHQKTNLFMRQPSSEIFMDNNLIPNQFNCSVDSSRLIDIVPVQ